MGKFLADPDDPLVTANGDVYAPDNEEHEPTREFTEKIVPAHKLRASTRRTIQDLPSSSPNEQMIVNVILTFHLLGMTENEISHHLSVSIKHVQKIKQSPAFQSTYDLLFSEMLEYNKTSTIARINAATTRAVDGMIDLLDDDEAPHMVRLKAQENILDRSGMSENALHGKNSKQDDGDQQLHIIIDDGREKEGATININFGNVGDGE